MGRISDEDVRRVRDATDLIALVSERVVLKQKGRLHWGCCPFHAEKTASFKVDPATQLWHCFGCGLGGDAYGFLMRAENVDFLDAVRILADRGNIEIVEESGGAPRGHRERLIAANEAAWLYYHEILTKSPDAGARDARDYLKQRGFGSDVAKRWRLGFAPGHGALVRHLAESGFLADEIESANLGLKGDGGQLRDRFFGRVMFPIFDLQGRSIAFGGRVIGSGEPKYLNTQDTPAFHKSANLYAIDRAKAAITSSGTAVVVEGYTDVIALHEAGLTNAVATLGTALTREHVRLLSRFAKRVVYLFDGDAAGLRAADRASEFIDSSLTPEAGRDRVELHVAVLPEGLDPADFVAANGADALRSTISEATPLLQFSIDRRLARWDLDRPEERTRALKDAAEVLAPIKDSLLADDYATYIADRLFADFATVRRAIAAARPTVSHAAHVDETDTAPQAEVADSPQLRAERELLDLLLRTPALRSGAQFLLSDDLLTDPAHRLIAQSIADSAPGATAAEILGSIQARMPAAASALAGSTLEVSGGEEAQRAQAELVGKLKEFDLERRIARGKARLKMPGSLQDKSEEAELFRSVSALQSELDRLRSGVRGN
ncbi:MAG: DNA primase [Coriobacteriia bacterium]